MHEKFPSNIHHNYEQVVSLLRKNNIQRLHWLQHMESLKHPRGKNGKEEMNQTTSGVELILPKTASWHATDPWSLLDHDFW